MARRQSQPSASQVVRIALATGTTVFGLLALLVARDDPRFWGAAGALGLLWWGWDLIVEHVVRPLGGWAVAVFSGGIGDGRPPPNTRPTLDDTIRLLESHLEGRASRQVVINAAIRLEEIYRTVKKDPSRARRAIAKAEQRFPGAEELQQYLDE